MAGQIKGIKIEFSADILPLTEGLKKAQGTLSKTQAELRDINKALRFNPRSAVLLEQKFDALKRSVTETDAKLHELKNLQNQMKAKGVKETSAQYKELQREIIKTQNNLDQARAKLQAFGSVGKQQVLAVGNSFKTAGSKIASAGKTITSTISIYGAAGIYTGKKLIDLSQAQAQAEQKLAEIYKTRMGVGKKAVKSTLQLASAEQQLGVVGDEVQLAGAQQLATYTQFPSSVNKMLPALNNLLVQQKGLNGTQEDAVNLANMFGKAMMGQTGALRRAGISFTDAQAEVLKYGTEEEKAAMLAQVVTENVGHMNSEFAKTDAGKIQQATNALGDMGEEIGAILLPAVADLVSWFQSNLMPKIQQFIDFMKAHPNIAKFALALAAITAAAGPLIVVVGSLISAIGGLVVIVGALDVAMLPIIGIIAAIVAAIALLVAAGVTLYKNWDSMKKSVSKVWNTLKSNVIKAASVIKSTVTKNFNTLKNSVSKTWNSIKNAITKPINSAKNTVSKAVKKIKGLFPLKIGKIFKGLKTPHFSLSWGSKDFGKLGTIRYPKGLGVSWYAKGGIFDAPSIIGVGEKGAEAVIPIDKLQTMINASNSQMISAMMTALKTVNTDGGGGEYTINLVLGGSKVATQVYKLSKQGKMILEA